MKKDLHITKVDPFVYKDDVIGDVITDRVDNSAWIYTSLLERGMKICINVGEFDLTEGARQNIEFVK